MLDSAPHKPEKLRFGYMPERKDDHGSSQPALLVQPAFAGAQLRKMGRPQLRQHMQALRGNDPQAFAQQLAARLA